MVDSTSNEMLTQHIVAAPDNNHIDRLNSATALAYSNIMSLIKMRQKDATKVSKLPKGVFKCILEYQFPNEFCWRYSDPFLPIKGQQDRHFPAIHKLDYENYLVAINEIPNST